MILSLEIGKKNPITNVNNSGCIVFVVIFKLVSVSLGQQLLHEVVTDFRH